MFTFPLSHFKAFIRYNRDYTYDNKTVIVTRQMTKHHTDIVKSITSGNIQILVIHCVTFRSLSKVYSMTCSELLERFNKYIKLTRDVFTGRHLPRVTISRRRQRRHTFVLNFDFTAEYMKEGDVIYLLRTLYNLILALN